MANPVAPGENGYNLLSKRHIFRVVILNGLVNDKEKPIKGPLVLEAKDGSYYHELEFSEAVKEGKHLIFEFQVRIRKNEYHCYIKDASRKFKWDLLPIGMITPKDIETEDQQANQVAA
jgi:hypothetical protein